MSNRIAWVSGKSPQDYAKALRNPGLVAKPSQRLGRESMRDLGRRAGSYAPRWRGGIASRFRAKITTGSDGVLTEAKTQNKARGAKPMEFGTGLLSTADDSKRSRYFPPPAALEGWALDHGFKNGFVVARAIWKNGGTAPREFLKRAIENDWPRIWERRGRNFANAVQRNFSKGA